MTELLYLRDTYLFEETANIIDISENEFGTYIILDRTIFYPQWGWQPSDTWTIQTDSWEFQVSMCKLSPEWLVYHYWEPLWEMEVWDQVNLHIDEDKRRLNARNHSAGHLLDIAISEIWYDHLEPGKWFHFPQWCYVEYTWEFDSEEKEEFIEKLENKINELIEKSIPMVISYEWLDEVTAPTWKIPRYAYFEWYDGCGCWWTHVKNSSEIWGVSIRKVKYKKWTLKISYSVS